MFREVRFGDSQVGESKIGNRRNDATRVLSRWFNEEIQVFRVSRLGVDGESMGSDDQHTHELSVQACDKLSMVPTRRVPFSAHTCPVAPEVIHLREPLVR